MLKPSPAAAVETIGLVVVKHTIEADPKAECVGHFPTHVVETRHPIVEGETVGELLARLGLDEGDRIELRWPTAAEEIAPVVHVLATIALSATNVQRLQADGSTRCTVCGGFTLHFEGCGADVLSGPCAEWPDADLHGRIAYLEGLETSDEDALTGSGYRELAALQAERERRAKVAC